jgi:hypothetical protein
MTITLEIGGHLLEAVVVTGFVLLVRWWWQARTGRRPL